MINYYLREFYYSTFLPDTNTETAFEGFFQKRELFTSEKEMLETLEGKINGIYETYQEISNSEESFDEYYKRIDPRFEIRLISLNPRTIETEEEYERYLSEVKDIKHEDLMDYLVSYTDMCIITYDYKLNIVETCAWLTNWDTEYSRQFCFAYKALFPDKYHVEKYQKGDKVLYEGKVYTAIPCKKNKDDIFTSDDPLDFHDYGYILMNEDGYIYQEDGKWSYFFVDEDLESAE